MCLFFIKCNLGVKEIFVCFSGHTWLYSGLIPWLCPQRSLLEGLRKTICGARYQPPGQPDARQVPYLLCYASSPVKGILYHHLKPHCYLSLSIGPNPSVVDNLENILNILQICSNTFLPLSFSFHQQIMA